MTMTHQFVVSIPFSEKETGTKGRQYLWVKAENSQKAREAAIEEAAGETAVRHRRGADLVINDPARRIEISAS
jgi:hypothetical protein